ncbi:hypothetical protein Tco_0961859 [Tanacetum coccineum]
MREFATNDQANYYSGITSITVNGKNAYELKGKFLDDLHNNAFSETKGEYAVKHIEYFLKIVNPIDLPNVNHDKLRVVVFPISLVGDAWKWFDEIKGSIDSWVDLTANFFGKYYPLSRTSKINTQMIKWDPTNPSWRNDGYCNEGNLHGAYLFGNSLNYLDYEWYEALEDSKLKQETLRNKAIMEGLINEDDKSSDEDGENDEHKLCGNETHELPVCQIKKYMMIKYSFRDDEKYVAIKEDEYDDFASASKEAYRAYQEIFHMIDEGWMVTIDE